MFGEHNASQAEQARRIVKHLPAHSVVTAEPNFGICSVAYHHQTNPDLPAEARLEVVLHEVEISPQSTLYLISNLEIEGLSAASLYQRPLGRVRLEDAQGGRPNSRESGYGFSPRRASFCRTDTSANSRCSSRTGGRSILACGTTKS
jgi:hypothetical protein